MYQVILANEAKKDLKKLDKRYKIKVSALIDQLISNPFIGQKMAGEFANSYRIKIPPLRIIYTLDILQKIIWIRAVGHRGDVYK